MQVARLFGTLARGLLPAVPPPVHSDTPSGPHGVHSTVHRLWETDVDGAPGGPRRRVDEAPWRHAGLQGKADRR